RARVDVNNVAHAVRERGVGRKLYDRCDRVPGRRAQRGGEQDDAGAGADLRVYALNVIPWSALKVAPRLGGILWLINNRADRRCSALFGGTPRFHGVGEQTVTHVSWRRIHIEAGSHRTRTLGIISHQLNEPVAHVFADGALD